MCREHHALVGRRAVGLEYDFPVFHRHRSVAERRGSDLASPQLRGDDHFERRPLLPTHGISRERHRQIGDIDRLGEQLSQFLVRVDDDIGQHDLRPRSHRQPGPMDRDLDVVHLAVAVSRSGFHAELVRVQELGPQPLKNAGGRPDAGEHCAARHGRDVGQAAREVARLICADAGPRVARVVVRLRHLDRVDHDVGLHQRPLGVGEQTETFQFERQSRRNQHDGLGRLHLSERDGESADTGKHQAYVLARITEPLASLAPQLVRTLPAIAAFALDRFCHDPAIALLERDGLGNGERVLDERDIRAATQRSQCIRYLRATAGQIHGGARNRHQPDRIIRSEPVDELCRRVQNKLLVARFDADQIDDEHDHASDIRRGVDGIGRGRIRRRRSRSEGRAFGRRSKEVGKLQLAILSVYLDGEIRRLEVADRPPLFVDDGGVDPQQLHTRAECGPGCRRLLHGLLVGTQEHRGGDGCDEKIEKDRDSPCHGV